MSRDVLTPPLQRMGPNRSYRVNLIHDDFAGPTANKQKQGSTAGGAAKTAAYTETDLYAGDDDEEAEEIGFTVTESNDGTFQLSMHVAQAFYGGIIGMKGSTKRRIETETKTEIVVPGKYAKQSEAVTIRGKERSHVCAARRQILALMESLRKRMRPTHFVCVSFHGTPIAERYKEFKRQVLEADLPGIDESLFQSESRVHLTFFVSVLLDEAERSKAVELLQSCREHAADLQTPFTVKVRGLEIMNDDPSAVRVLYGRVEAPDLEQFGNRCMATFVPTGLGNMDFGRDHVKLHMTVLNQSFRKKELEKSSFGRGGKGASNFDAREILKRFGDFDFGEVQCKDVHLCVMSGQDIGKDFYRISGTLQL